MSPNDAGCPGHLDQPHHFDIPYAYTLNKLHELAPLFWRDASSSNCTILVRVDADADLEDSQGVTTFTPPPTPRNAPSPLPAHPPDGADEDGLDQATASRSVSQLAVLTYKLHRDYLAPQSQLFRRFLSSPLTPPPTSTAFPAVHLTNARMQVVPSLTTSTHTTLLLTLPDPASFPVILHYLYWGLKDVVLGALEDGKIGWKGLVNNVEYLGLDDRLKAVCGQYWKEHIRPREDSPGTPPLSSFIQTSPPCINR